MKGPGDLVFFVIVAIYVVVAIVKALNKQKQEQSRHPSTDRPQRDLSEGGGVFKAGESDIREFLERVRERSASRSQPTRPAPRRPAAPRPRSASSDALSDRIEGALGGGAAAKPERPAPARARSTQRVQSAPLPSRERAAPAGRPKVAREREAPAARTRPTRRKRSKRRVKPVKKAPAAAAKKTVQRLVTDAPKMQRTRRRRRGTGIAGALAGLTDMQRAIALSEIIGKPRAMDDLREV